MRNLGEVFDSLAYEYKLTQAIRDGYLCKIMAQTIPLQLDISTVGMSGGDYAVQGLGTALDPYLDQIAGQMGALLQRPQDGGVSAADQDLAEIPRHPQRARLFRR